MRKPAICAAMLLGCLLPGSAAGQTLPRGYETVQVTYGAGNQSPEINDLSEICWTRYDFCTPHNWKIMLYSGGQTFELTDGESFPQNPGD